MRLAEELPNLVVENKFMPVSWESKCPTIENNKSGIQSNFEEMALHQIRYFYKIDKATTTWEKRLDPIHTAGSVSHVLSCFQNLVPLTN